MRTRLLSAAALAAATGTVVHAEFGEVTITEMSWASSAIVTSVSKFIM